MRPLLAFLFFWVAVPAFAETNWLSPEQFEEKVIGRATRVFLPDGTLFGTEYFLPNRRTIWLIADDKQCYSGSWVPRQDLVCYQYQGGLGSCLRYHVQGDKLVSTDWIAGIRTSNTFNLVIVDELPPTCTFK